jgi:hypothetical protein
MELRMLEDSLPTLKGVFEFTNLGRSKGRLTKRIHDDADVLPAVRTYFMSNDISWSYCPDTNVGTIFVGGFRNVGDFKRVGD